MKNCILKICDGWWPGCNSIVYSLKHNMVEISSVCDLSPVRKRGQRWAACSERYMLRERGMMQEGYGVVLPQHGFFLPCKDHSTALNHSISSSSAVSIIRMCNNTLNWLMTVSSLSCKGPLIAVDMAFIDPALVRINKVCCSHSLLSDLLICISSLMTDECVWGAVWSDNGCMCVCVCV